MRKPLIALLVFVSCPLVAWDHHDWITAEAIRKLPLPEVFVPYETLESALARGLTRAQSRNREGLVRELKLHKAWEFENRLGERPGAQVSAVSVLSTYSDEPDWGADQNLFEPDQYPELWTDDTAYVSQKTGLGSQGFRHMFFPARLHWREPLSTLQIPMRPLGEAPQRAAIFFDLSQDCFRKGASYWGLRFLAWALHYVQDLHQPWHSRQLPIKSLVQFQYKWGFFPILDVAGTAEQVSYYHLSFEKFIEEKMAPADSPLRGALGGVEPVPPVGKALAVYLADDVVDFAGSHAYRIAKASEQAFPWYDHRQSPKPKDRIGTKDWRAAIREGEASKEMEQLTMRLFTRLGGVVRRLVLEAWVPGAPR